MGKNIVNTDKFNWKEHWKDMPEFVQEDKEAIKTINVSFETEEDMAVFSMLTGIPVTMKTKGVFFPLKKPEVKKEYVDES